MGAVRILVVDDEESVLRFAETVLRAGGYDVLPAADAKQALIILENQPEPVDILLSDVRMPGMSGPQLVKSVRESFPGTVPVFMSGHVGSEEIDPAIPIIHKPFSAPTLLQNIQEVWACQQDLMAQLTDRCIAGRELMRKHAILVAELRYEIAKKALGRKLGAPAGGGR